MPALADPQSTRERIVSAAGVALFHALLGYAFLTGLGFDIPAQVERQLKVFDISAEPPSPPAELPPPDIAPSDKAQTKDPEGSASPANLKDTPSEIVAPPPEIRIPVPPPVIAAPAAGQGSAPAAGATDIRGPGTGSGGQGTGLGSGLYGDGTGGGGGGRGTPVQQIAGGIYDRDYPRAAFDAGRGGTVYLRFVVAPTGRVSECRVTRSSGDRSLDETTCRLIRQRFRYRPARDPRGTPIAATITGQHEWVAQRRSEHIILEDPDGPESN